MAERKRPDIASTIDCIDAALKVAKLIPHPPSRKIMVQAIDEMKQQLMEAEAALTKQKGPKRLDVDYAEILRKLEVKNGQMLEFFLQDAAKKSKGNAIRKTHKELLAEDPFEFMNRLRDSIELRSQWEFPLPQFVKNRRVKGPRPLQPLEGTWPAWDAAENEFQAIYTQIETAMRKIQPGLLGQFRRDAMHSTAANTYRYLAGGTPPVEDQVAREIAEILKPIYTGLIKRQRDAGVPHREIEFWAPQNHHVAKIVPDKKSWIEFTASRLDPEKHPDPEDFLDTVYRRMHQEFQDVSETGGLLYSSERQMHFANAEFQLEYFNEYGEGTVFENLVNSLRRMVYRANIAEVWGPRPFELISELADEAHDLVRDNQSARLSDANDLRRNIDILVREARGDGQHVAQGKIRLAGIVPLMERGTFAALAQSLRNMYVGGMLGFTMRFSLSGDLLYGATARSAYRGLKGGHLIGTLSDMVHRASDLPKEDQARIRRQLGIMVPAIHSVFTDKFLSVGTTPGDGLQGLGQTKGNRVANLQFKLSAAEAAFVMRWQGLEMLTRGLISGHGWNTVIDVFEHAGKSWGQFAGESPILSRRMREVGFGQNMFEALVRPEHMTGQLLDPDKIALDNKAAQNALKAFRAYINTESRFVVARPDMMTKAIMRGSVGIAGRQTLPFARGTALGETALSATQFGGFLIQAFRHLPARASRDGFGSFAGLIGTLTVAGVLMVQFEEIWNDRRPFDWNDPLLYLKGSDRSGLFFTIPSLIYNFTDADRMDRRIKAIEIPSTVVPGPFFDHLADVTEDGLQWWSAAMGEDDIVTTEDRDAIMSVIGPVIPSNFAPVDAASHLLAGSTLRKIVREEFNPEAEANAATNDMLRKTLR